MAQRTKILPLVILLYEHQSLCVHGQIEYGRISGISGDAGSSENFKCGNLDDAVAIVMDISQSIWRNNS